MLWQAVFILSVWHIQSVFATCYTPNGTDRNTFPDAGENVYRPCITGEVSMCCRYGYNDCSAGGFCYDSASNVYWRESCTDITWKSPNCIKLFTDVGDTDVQVTNCGDGRWCLGKNNNSCCLAKQGYFIVNGEPTTQDPNQVTTSSSSSTSSTSTTTALISSSPSPTGSSSSKLPGSTIAGIVVGVVVGLGILLAAGFWLIRKKKRSKLHDVQESNTDKPFSFAAASPGYFSGSEVGGNTVHEKDSIQSPSARAGQAPVELGTDASYLPYRDERRDQTGI